MSRRFSLKALISLVTLIAVSCIFLFPPKRSYKRTVQLLPPSNGAPATPTYYQTELALLCSPFVVSSALREIQATGTLSGLDEMANPVSWLSQNLNVELTAESNAVVSLTSSELSSKELERIVEGVVDAFHREVVDNR